MSHSVSVTPRRGFLSGLAATAASLVVARWSVASAEEVQKGEGAPLGDEWLGRIKGKYRQVFDCTTPNDGFGAAFPLNFIDSTKDALKLTDKDITGVVVFRHMSTPLMLNDSAWAKYHIGEMLGIKDPKTNAPAMRNIFRDNIPMRPGLTYEQEMASHGVIFTACNMALTALSGMAAPKASVTADQAKKDWTAALLPGVFLVPSGVYAVNRAQQAGCTYCYGG
jgi:intracellular sulfur oxidation DsrE/DsrF family protein